MNVKDLLKGTKVGNLQSVGFMQVIPLLSEVEFDEFNSPKGGTRFGTSSYGTMNFKNTTDKTVIIPSNTAYLKKSAGQDHSMMHAGIVNKGASKSYNTAVCIQQTRGGAFPTGDHKFTILPFALRDKANSIRKVSKMDRMWGAISTFNKSIGIAGNAHLEYFFDNFDKEIDQFVAEFETVPKQVGAIVLINGIVVGIERAPNYRFWKDIWSELIRSCYGSLAIQLQREGKLDKKRIDSIRVKLDTRNVSDLDSLERELNKIEDTQLSNVKEIVKSVLDEEFEKVEDDETDAGIKRINVSNSRFRGQVIQSGSAAVYASLVTTNDWLKNSKWHEATDFEM